jgi:hypothetical protein
MSRALRIGEMRGAHVAIERIEKTAAVPNP